MTKRAHASGTAEFQVTADNAIVRLSVAGTPFTTTRATLCAAPGSVLAVQFQEASPFGEPLTDASGAVFIDRDPHTFAWILDFLRRGCKLVGAPKDELMLARLRDDADYYGLTSLVAALDDNKFHPSPVAAVQFNRPAAVPAKLHTCDETAKSLTRGIFLKTDERACDAPVYVLKGDLESKIQRVLRRWTSGDNIEWIVSERQYMESGVGIMRISSEALVAEDIQGPWRLWRGTLSGDDWAECGDIYLTELG